MKGLVLLYMSVLVVELTSESGICGVTPVQ